MWKTLNKYANPGAKYDNPGHGYSSIICSGLVLIYRRWFIFRFFSGAELFTVIMRIEEWIHCLPWLLTDKRFVCAGLNCIGKSRHTWIRPFLINIAHIVSFHPPVVTGYHESAALWQMKEPVTWTMRTERDRRDRVLPISFTPRRKTTRCRKRRSTHPQTIVRKMFSVQFSRNCASCDNRYSLQHYCLSWLFSKH
jgi:hypothetical protein